MRYASIVVVGVIICAVGNTTFVAAEQQTKAEQELTQLERDWCTASLKKDASALARILADDYTGVGSRGGTSTKASELAALKDPDVVTSCVDENIKVRLYGDTAVVTGLGKRAGTFKGAAYKDRQALWTDVFVKKDGRWQCVASQSTLVGSQQ